MIILLLGVTMHNVWDTEKFLKQREENQKKHNKIMHKLHKNIHKKDSDKKAEGEKNKESS